MACRTPSTTTETKIIEVEYKEEDVPVTGMLPEQVHSFVTNPLYYDNHAKKCTYGPVVERDHPLSTHGFFNDQFLYYMFEKCVKVCDQSNGFFGEYTISTETHFYDMHTIIVRQNGEDVCAVAYRAGALDWMVGLCNQGIVKKVIRFSGGDQKKWTEENHCSLGQPMEAFTQGARNPTSAIFN